MKTVSNCCQMSSAKLSQLKVTMIDNDLLANVFVLTHLCVLHTYEGPGIELDLNKCLYTFFLNR